MSLNPIKSIDSTVYFCEEGYGVLGRFVLSDIYSDVFILTDNNTCRDCLPVFLSVFPDGIKCKRLQIPAGEDHKNIDTCMELWRKLSDKGADSKSLIINIGGGVVTDLGGFVACTFKRGVDYINIPTTLLSMVDASVGGKTGVDLGGLKNQIGVIKESKMVIIDTSYLKTLPRNELRSGLAEMLKHSLISNSENWEILKIKSFETPPSKTDISVSIKVKNEIITDDIYERGRRKTLNFGHTLGHAIETHFLNHRKKKALLHGEAIAIGMVLESYLSHKTLHLPYENIVDIKNTFGKYFSAVSFEKQDITSILSLLKHDKKNSHGRVNFVLLEAIGKAVWDCEVSDEDILEAFIFYQK